MAEVLSALRSLMASHSPPIDALAIPSEDYHQSEYVSSRDKRREFVSGFTGSAGLALITSSEALLWTDGRYFLQAEQQLSGQWKLMRMGEDPVVEKWISDNLPRDSTVGVDSWCISIDTAQRWQHSFSDKQQKLIQTSGNLVDEVWTDRPAEDINPVTVQPLSFSGRSVAEKLVELRKNLARKKASGIIITSLDEVAWLYNIRGGDVPYCPVVHAFAIVKSDSASLYVDRRKVSTDVASYLEENGITVKDYDSVASDVQKLGAHASKEGTELEEGFHITWVPPSTCCHALFSKLEQDKLLLEQSPISLAKALKNPVELQGLKSAHIRDGAAVVQYLAWLDQETQKLYGASGYFSEAESTTKNTNSPLTEITVSDKLEEFRASKEHFKGLSFPTISSIGPNAAVIHYSPEEGKCSEFDPDSIYLFDSGAQYQDGTTDITRTVHFGKPSDHEKTCYTLVLKGHIALGEASFPKGTNGHALDVLARTHLWRVGLDYRHGTGHGVGSYLNVHEGPHLISFKPQVKNVPLEASMTVTDEPGYYEDGNFGIRLENVLVVKEADTLFNFGGKGYLSFEHITWAPYQKKLMELSLLTDVEVKWLDSYHSKCREVLTPFLSETEMGWLVKATEPIIG